MVNSDNNKKKINWWWNSGSDPLASLNLILTNGIGFMLFDDGNFFLETSNTKAANQSIDHLEDLDDQDFETVQALKILYNY